MTNEADKRIAFLHTSPVHVATFEQLVAELAPGTPTVHIVHESLLAEARATGITAEVTAHVTAAIEEAAAQSAVILCTCSTIGACAEAITPSTGQPVLRVDRAMAERAVTRGSRIVLAAALQSTLTPTRKLLETVAATADKSILITDCFCVGACIRDRIRDGKGYQEG